MSELTYYGRGGVSSGDNEVIEKWELFIMYWNLFSWVNYNLKLVYHCYNWETCLRMEIVINT